jgi:hypothetical protein
MRGELARLFEAEARHHLSPPASWNEHVSPHVVRRVPSEGYRLAELAGEIRDQGEW